MYILKTIELPSRFSQTAGWNPAFTVPTISRIIDKQTDRLTVLSYRICWSLYLLFFVDGVDEFQPFQLFLHLLHLCVHCDGEVEQLLGIRQLLPILVELGEFLLKLFQQLNTFVKITK